jgi:hypothetical protein
MRRSCIDLGENHDLGGQHRLDHWMCSVIVARPNQASRRARGRQARFAPASPVAFSHA